MNHFLLAWALIATGMLLYLKSPFHDPGSWIFRCTSDKAWITMVKLMERREIFPVYRIESRYIKRAIMKDGTILNVVSDELSQSIGNAAGGKAFVVKDPIAEATDDAATLMVHGFKAVVIPDPEPGLGPNKLAFVLTDALFGGNILVTGAPSLR